MAAAILGAACLFGTGPAGASAAARGACTDDALSIGAHMYPPVADAVVLVTIVNDGPACTVDRYPTVTFPGFDGSALPEPPDAGGPPRHVKAGQSLYAAVRTALPATDVRWARAITIAPDAGRTGTTFDAADIGAEEPGLPLYDPVTTWWHTTPEAARSALPGP